jgi:hypothetical protein
MAGERASEEGSLGEKTAPADTERPDGAIRIVRRVACGVPGRLGFAVENAARGGEIRVLGLDCGVNHGVKIPRIRTDVSAFPAMKTTYLRSHRARILAVALAVLLPSAGLFPIELSSGAVAVMWLAGVALLFLVVSDYATTSPMHEHPHPDIHPHPGSPHDHPPLAGGDHWPHQSASG